MQGGARTRLAVKSFLSTRSICCSRSQRCVQRVAQLLNFKPSYCPHHYCTNPWTKWRSIKAYHAHIMQCQPGVSFPAAAAPSAVPAAAASAAAAPSAVPVPSSLPLVASPSLDVQSGDALLIDGLKQQLAERTAAMLELQQQQSNLQQAAQHTVQLKEQLAQNLAVVSELQQKQSELQQRAELAQTDAERHRQLAADLQSKNDAALASKNEKRKSVSPSSSDSDADVAGNEVQSKKPKQESELWMKDIQPLDESLQGGLAEVGVGVLYTPSRLLPMGHERKSKLIVCLYKQTFAHAGNLYMVHSELIALQRLQLLASPWFPHFTGELNILAPTENKQQERVVRGIAMEFIPGITLSRLLKPSNGFPSFLCMSTTLHRLQLCIQLARGMEQLHRARIVHRDIKPANLIVAAPDIYKHMVDKQLLPELVRRMRTQNWIDHGSIKHLKPTSAGYKCHAAIVSPKEASSVLHVNRFCTPGAHAIDQGAPPQPMDVAGARLVILDLNTCDVLPQDNEIPPKYASPFGTALFQWRNWFGNTQCFKINKCKDASEGFDFDTFAVGIVIMDLLRTISVERVPSLETAKSLTAQYPFIKQSFTPFCDAVFTQSPSASTSSSIVVPSLALFFRDAILDPILWSAGFVAANTQLSALFTSQPPLFELLHSMTRIRFSQSRTDELRIPPLPSMASTSNTLTAMLATVNQA